VNRKRLYRSPRPRTRTYRDIAVKNLLIDFVHMKQAIRRALIESGILDVLANDPGTLLVATAKEIAAVVTVMMMMSVFVPVSVLVL